MKILKITVIPVFENGTLFWNPVFPTRRGYQFFLCIFCTGSPPEIEKERLLRKREARSEKTPVRDDIHFVRVVYLISLHYIGTFRICSDWTEPTGYLQNKGPE